MNDKDILLKDLKELEVVKYGDFTLKSGQKSNVYVDFRKVISYPEIFSRLCYELYKLIDKDDDCILCPVPMGAIPYTTMLSYFSKIPMIMVRKERKNYGTQKMIEGDDFDDEVIIVEDTITTGESVLDIAILLDEHDKKVRKIVAILDRGNNKDRFKQLGYPLETLFTLDDLKN